MATHVDMEMSSCLSEMERLQAKMMELQNTEKKQQAEQEEKRKEIEPNVLVMKKWLDIYHFNQEQKRMSDVAKKNYDEYFVRIRGRNEYGEETRGGFEQPPRNQIFPGNDAVEARRLRHERMHCDHRLQHEKKVMDDYRKYCTTKSDKYQSWIVPNNLKPIRMFHTQQYKTPDTPSQFMFDFIEATHNLFQIQQKRIDELETVVEKLSEKIQ